MGNFRAEALPVVNQQAPLFPRNNSFGDLAIFAGNVEQRYGRWAATEALNWVSGKIDAICNRYIENGERAGTTSLLMKFLMPLGALGGIAFLYSAMAASLVLLMMVYCVICKVKADMHDYREDYMGGRY